MTDESEILEIATRLLGRVHKTGPENVMAFCPFHLNQNTPSFALSVTNGLWFCHSCKVRGNFRMLLQALGVSPQLISTQYKFLIETLNTQASFKEKRRSHVVLEDAPPLEEAILGFFEGCPLALLDEGFEENTLWRFDVGYDERNQRITYPLRDFIGRLVGISGRAIGDRLPRYKVYDEDEYKAWGITPRKTEKRNILWNSHKVYPEAYHSTNPDIVLVEGFKGCMWVQQAGFPNVIATLGSHLSYQQRLLLERLGGTVYVFYDNDPAGFAGRDHAVKELSRAMRVKIVEYEERQPTDVSPQRIVEMLNSAPDYLAWAIRQER